MGPYLAVELAGALGISARAAALHGSDGAGVPLYTNWPAAVYFHLHRPARELPTLRDARTLAAFADTVRVRGGRVLVFDAQTTEFAPQDSLVKTRGLRTLARLRDGVVLGP